MIGEFLEHGETRFVLAIDQVFEMRQFKPGTDVPGERHFGDGNQNSAIGHVMRRSDQPLIDQLADEFAVTAFGVEVDCGRRPILAAMDFAQPYRLAHH